jgi:PBP1b-binding outer membrane lipoprotein LpoB
MKKFITLLFIITLFFASCNNKQTTKQDNKDLASLFENYYRERMQLVPIESTQNGDSTNNDKLYADFTDSYREKYRQFFTHYLD